MTIMDMNNLYTGYNETEKYTVFIVALDSVEALEIARGYGSDAGLTNDWKILDFDITDESDCDYILG